MFSRFFFSLTLIVGATSVSYAQVGIHTSSPKATLDVTLPTSYTSGALAGVSFPQLSGDLIEAMSTTELKAGTLVFANSPSTSTLKDIDSSGYWYWTGDSTKKWEPLFLTHKSVVSYFYAPSVALPMSPVGVSTDSSNDISYNASSATYSVKLFSIYQKQYSLSGNVPGNNRTAIKNASAVGLPTLTSTDLDYFVTYFDNTVFNPSSITLSNDGVLTYQIINDSVASENTFMNIVFKVK